MATENDLSGKISLDTTAFRAGVTALNNEIKNIETGFRASAVVMGNWSSTSDGLKSRVDSLNEKLTLQRNKLQGLTDEFKLLSSAEGDHSKDLASYATQMNTLERQINSTEKDLKNYSAQLKDVDSKSKGLDFKTFNDGLAKTSEAASKALKTVGLFAAGVAGAFGKMLQSSVSNADELQKLSDVTGFTAEQLQVMKYQGSALGVELDTMTGAQSKLIKAMNAASTGKNGPNAQAKAFQELGIQVRDSSGHLRNSNDVFNETISKLGGVKNETDRDALAMQIFGKSAMSLNPLIKAGGGELKNMADEAKKNGAVMSNDAVAGLDNFGDSVDAMKLSISGLIGSAFGKLTPQLNDLTTKIKNLDLSKVTEGISFALEHLPQIGTAIVGITGALVAWKIAAMTANAVNAISNGIQAISTARTLLAKNLTLAQVAATKLATGAQIGLNAAILANPITWIIVGIAALVAAFVILWNNCEGFRNFWIGLWAGIQSAAQAVGTWFSGPFVDFFKSAWAGIQGAFSAVGNWFSGVFSAAASGIQAAWSGVTGFFSSVWQGIVNIFSVVGNWFKNVFGTAWNGIKSIWSGVTGFFSGVWSGITGIFGTVGNWFSGVFKGAYSGITNAFSGLTGFFTGIWNGITGAFKSAINFIISGVNTLISGLDSIHFELPDWVPLIGGKFFGISIPSIPYLASGGIIDRATLAVLGEAGKEAVVPLERNTAWIKSLARDLATALSSASISVSMPTRMQPAYAGVTAATPASYTYYQYVTSPKALSPSETARQTRNLLRQARLQSRK